MIRNGPHIEMTPTEQMLSDAHSLLSLIDESFMLLHYYPYLDRDRSQAIELEGRIKEFLKRPLYGDAPTVSASD